MEIFFFFKICHPQATAPAKRKSWDFGLNLYSLFCFAFFFYVPYSDSCSVLHIFILATVVYNHKFNIYLNYKFEFLPFAWVDKMSQLPLTDPFHNTSAPVQLRLPDGSSACVDKTTKIITEFTHKDPFLHMKRAN